MHEREFPVVLCFYIILQYVCRCLVILKQFNAKCQLSSLSKSKHSAELKKKTASCVLPVYFLEYAVIVLDLRYN